MTVQIRTKWPDDYGKPKYAYIDTDEALRLYEGGLYKLLQQELREIQKSTVNRKDELKELNNLTKKFDELGIKPLKAGEELTSDPESDPAHIQMYKHLVYGEKGKR